MNILVTGCASMSTPTFCVELLKKGHSVIIDDNLTNSKIDTIDKKSNNYKDIIFYQIDVTDASAVESIFNNRKIDGIIHFAGIKAIGGSVEKQLKY